MYAIVQLSLQVPVMMSVVNEKYPTTLDSLNIPPLVLTVRLEELIMPM